MKTVNLIVLITISVLVWGAGFSIAAANESSPGLDQIMDGIEKKYAGSGFSADFYQESTLKEMDITDTASGKVYIKKPGMMRWEYISPENQIIITDSQTLWIYRPEDNQVMLGEAPEYFGDGKGASFLSDMKLVRKNFHVHLEIVDTPAHHILKLVPVKKQADLTEIYLSVTKQNYIIEQIITYNAYQDKTVIKLSRFGFNQQLGDELFRFDIPEGVDILRMDK